MELIYGDRSGILFLHQIIIRKCYSLCVSLKKDVDLYPPLYMDALSIIELDVLKVFGIHFD